MKTSVMIGYIVAQMTGAVIGCLPLLLIWDEQGSSIGYVSLFQERQVLALLSLANCLPRPHLFFIGTFL